MHVEAYGVSDRIFYYCTHDAEKDGYVGLHAVIRSTTPPSRNLVNEVLGTYSTTPPGFGYNLCQGVYGISNPTTQTAKLFAIVRFAMFK